MASCAIAVERVAALPFKLASRAVRARASSGSFERRTEALLDKLTVKNFAVFLAVLMLFMVTVAFFTTPEMGYALTKSEITAKIDFSKIAKLEADAEDPFDLTAVFDGVIDALSAKNPVNFLLQPFATLINMAVIAPKYMLLTLFVSSPLANSFEQLSPELFSTIENAHKSVIIPLGNSVALIVFAVGLVKVFANSSSTEAGIDLWKIVLIFISFGATLIIINTSWEIMVALFNLMQHAIVGIANVSVNASSQTAEFAASPNMGSTLLVLLTVIVGFAAIAYAVIVCNVMTLARGIEIYMYACYSPVAFAFLVTEGGRQMTEAFLKRYAAVLLAGAIQLLLLMLLAAAVPNMGNVGEWASNPIEWIVEYINSYVIVFVVAYMMKRSTTLAKDIIGTN